MSDFFFKKYYDDIKDPSWPEISNYVDFLKLPKHIVDECHALYNLNDRLDELGNIFYWANQSGLNHTYCYKNVAYLPIPKCASTYYTNIFHGRYGWKKNKLLDIDLHKTKIFAFVMHPLTRRLKGLTQSLVRSYNNDYDTVLNKLQDESFLDFLSNIMLTDYHTIPYSLLLKPWFDHVHWIPIDLLSRLEAKKEIITFLKNNDIVIDFPDEIYANQSNDKKIIIFKILEQLILLKEPPAELGLLFAHDIKFYNKLMSKYAQV